MFLLGEAYSFSKGARKDSHVEPSLVLHEVRLQAGLGSPGKVSVGSHVPCFEHYVHGILPFLTSKAANTDYIKPVSYGLP